MRSTGCAGDHVGWVGLCKEPQGPWAWVSGRGQEGDLGNRGEGLQRLNDYRGSGAGTMELKGVQQEGLPTLPVVVGSGLPSQPSYVGPGEPACWIQDTAVHKPGPWGKLLWTRRRGRTREDGLGWEIALSAPSGV